MKQLTNNILVGLGVIFLIIMISGVVFFIVDPYNLKPLLFGTSFTPVKGNSSETPTSTSTDSMDGDFQLSEAQKQALISFGVDPSIVPSSLSVEQEACFVSVLGEARVAEIKAGAVPSGLEFFRAKSCV